jgi:hypothetical protein
MDIQGNQRSIFAKAIDMGSVYCAATSGPQTKSLQWKLYPASPNVLIHTHLCFRWLATPLPVGSCYSRYIHPKPQRLPTNLG